MIAVSAPARVWRLDRFKITWQIFLADRLDRAKTGPHQTARTNYDSPVGGFQFGRLDSILKALFGWCMLLVRQCDRHDLAATLVA